MAANISRSATRWIAAAALSSSLGAATAGCGWASGGRMIHAAPRGADPSSFMARTRRQMDEVTERAYRDVQRGRLRAEAIDEVRNRRHYIEQLMIHYANDGAIERDERRHVDAAVDDMSDALERFEQRGGRGRWRSSR